MITEAQLLREGRAELKKALRTGRNLFIGVFIFSFFVNLLMLTGPLFMLQVYDRVLSSRSMSTLVVLFILVGGLFACMGMLDYVRARVLARAGARFQSVLDRRVFSATLARSVAPSERSRPAMGLRDLEAIQRMLSGPAPFAFFDAPWAPLYMGAIFLFHPWLGYLALAGALTLFSLTFFNEIYSRNPQRKAVEAQALAESFESTARREAETLRGLGMRDTAMARWLTRREGALSAQMQASDRTGMFTAASKTLRFFLQSAMLALGAALVIYQEISPGVMIASSILMGRALAPVEQAIGQWAVLQRARQGWRSLSELLSKTPAPPERMPLPRPTGRLEARGVAVAAPGMRVPTVRGLAFAVNPGEAVGIIGPSGAGKSTLARILSGIWPPLAGELRLDGATLDQWDADALGRAVGYLPQDVSLLDGTIAENIARLDPNPDPERVLEAARRAGAHDTILGMNDGYETQIGMGGAQLSGGQRQRVALARALYGDPALVVLDEPNANLDSEGEQALHNAILDLKKRGRSVIIIAHRPSAIAACDKILMIDQGQQRAFGPKEEVLRQTTRNFPQIVRNQQGQKEQVEQQPAQQPSQNAPAAKQEQAPGQQGGETSQGQGGISLSANLSSTT